ncbi:Gfo/Idh/MocA family protein [Mycobacterium haemophilum]|nr:Gfo/Idh/MocA family oxidoreductase [Mycobacterium haemophilum]
MNPQLMTKSAVRWGILGAARIAENYAIPAICKLHGSRVYAISSRRRERAEHLGHQFDINCVYDSYRQLVEAPDVDAVYIALPNALHADWVIAALENGKHVLCEKPITTSIADVSKIEDAALAAGKLAAEAMMYRHHPQFECLLAMVAKGVVGEVHSVHGVLSFMLDDPGDIRMSRGLGGGALLDLACYAVDASSMIYGCPPCAGAAVSFRADGNVDVDLHTTGILEYPGGNVASVEASFRLPWLESRLQVYGEEGSLLLPHAFNPGTAPTELIHNRPDGSTHVMTFAGVNMYERMFAAFTRSIENNLDATALIGGSKAVQVGLELLASHQSLQDMRCRPA